MDSSKLPITGPCPIDLDAIGFDRTGTRSHCSHCEKSVHILSNMTRREASALLREKAGQRICVSYARDASGTIQFKSEPPPAQIVPLSRLQRGKPSVRPTAAAVAGLGLAAALAACTPHDTTEHHMLGEAPVEVVDGGIEAPHHPEAKPEQPDDKAPCNKDGGDQDGDVEMIEGEIEPLPAGDMMVPPVEELEAIDHRKPLEVVAGGITAEMLPQPQPQPLPSGGSTPPPVEE